MTFSAVYERFLLMFRQKPVSHDPTDRLFGLGIVFFAIVHRVFLSFKRSHRLNDPIVLNAPIVFFLERLKRSDHLN